MTDTGSAPARLPLARRSAMSVGMWLPIAVVLALVLFFSVASGAFLTLRNLTAISGQSSALLSRPRCRSHMRKPDTRMASQRPALSRRVSRTFNSTSALIRGWTVSAAGSSDT